MCRCLCLCAVNKKNKNGNDDSSSSQKNHPKTKFYYKNSCEKNDGSGKRPSVKTRCMEAVNEQRARFYIIRRCVTMLLCWHRYEDA